MGNQKLRFDFQEAKNLEAKLDRELEGIKATLSNSKRSVEGVREWWKGGSEEGFIDNFEKTKNEVTALLQKWLDTYKERVQQVSTIKRQQDDELARQLRG